MKVQKGQPSRRQELFGGAKAVTVWDLLGRSAAPPFTAVLACELAPGGSVGRHQQEEFPEIVIVLEGEGEAYVDDQPRPMRAGEVIHLPLGAILAIANHSETEPLRYLIVKARG